MAKDNEVRREVFLARDAQSAIIQCCLRPQAQHPTGGTYADDGDGEGIICEFVDDPEASEIHRLVEALAGDCPPEGVQWKLCVVRTTVDTAAECEADNKALLAMAKPKSKIDRAVLRRVGERLKNW